jgi:hypothetical protein
MNYSKESIYDLENKVYTKGDTIAYNKLNIAYLDMNPKQRFYTDFIMANKYDYTLAYYNVFLTLCQLNNIDLSVENLDLNRMDKKTCTFSLDYLKVAAERKLPDAMNILGNLYINGKYIEKNINKGNELIQDAEKNK